VVCVLVFRFYGLHMPHSQFTPFLPGEGLPAKAHFCSYKELRRVTQKFGSQSQKTKNLPIWENDSQQTPVIRKFWLQEEKNRQF
jgi:hypothetical protein